MNEIKTVEQNYLVEFGFKRFNDVPYFFFFFRIRLFVFYWKIKKKIQSV